MNRKSSTDTQTRIKTENLLFEKKNKYCYGIFICGNLPFALKSADMNSPFVSI